MKYNISISVLAVGLLAAAVPTHASGQVTVAREYNPSLCAPVFGEWVKGIKGKGTMSVANKSTASVEVYEKIFLGDWNLVRTIRPGGSETLDIDGKVKFVVRGRTFLGASDVNGGFDAHWTDVWLSWRQ
jgi:hypothetical protein